MKKKILFFNIMLFINLICISVVNAETYNENYNPATTSCGNNLITDIPTILPTVVSILYTAIQIVVPVILVIFGSLDLFKGITAGKEDEMKKGQQMFIKRLIYAALIFFVFIVVRLVVSISVDDTNDQNRAERVLNCAECFIKNKCGD